MHDIKIIFILGLSAILLAGCSPNRDNASTQTPLYQPSQAQAIQQSLVNIAHLPESERSVTSVADIINGQNISPPVMQPKPNPMVYSLMQMVGFTLTGQSYPSLPSVLQGFQQTYPIFGYVKPEIYQLDASRQLLGYVYKTDGARFYVILNLSYDIHEIPFPLGFMSSTKVSIWHSDTDGFATFVTQSPLSIQPLTLVIVKV